MSKNIIVIPQNRVETCAPRTQHGSTPVWLMGVGFLSSDKSVFFFWSADKSVLYLTDTDHAQTWGKKLSIFCFLIQVNYVSAQSRFGMKESRRPLTPGRRSNLEVSFFRFSFCSQVELESMNVGNLNPSSATVLMVNLDNGLTDSRSRELKWKRIESLERSISPVAHTLIRFSYGEILYATRNFSKGIESGLFVFWIIFVLAYGFVVVDCDWFCCCG